MLAETSSQTTNAHNMADEQDLWAQMGMPMSFGKQAKKKAASRNFDQMKRAEVS